jgi:hypothetical protein
MKSIDRKEVAWGKLPSSKRKGWRMLLIETRNPCFSEPESKRKQSERKLVRVETRSRPKGPKKGKALNPHSRI